MSGDGAGVVRPGADTPDAIPHATPDATRDAYALWARGYPPEAHNALMRAEERAMLALLPRDLSGQDLLDVGCGTGRYLLHASRRGVRRAVGVDPSHEMLDGARRAWPSHCGPGSAQPRLVRGLAEALPFDAASFDVVVCALVLGHVPALAPTLCELARVVRPGGLVVCSDLHPIGATLGWRRTFSAGGRTHVLPHTTHDLARWTQAARECGLGIVAVEEPCLDPADVPSPGPGEASLHQVPVALVLALCPRPSH